MDKKSAAKILYDKGVNNKDIATILKVAAKTVGTWATDGNWKEQKQRKDLFRQTNEERVLELIDFNLYVLTKIKDVNYQKAEETDDPKELEKLLTNKGDVDALTKLFSNIKGKELDWEKQVDIAREIFEYIAEDSDLAQDVMPYFNQFINDKRNKL